MAAMWKTLLAKATSTTEVFVVAAARMGRQIVIRALEATGAHASSLLKVYIPKADYLVELADDLASNGTGAKFASASESAASINGHTLTTSDFLLIETSAGLAIKAISGVSTTNYVTTATIVATGKALAAGSKCWIVRAADVKSLTVGSGSISKLNLFAGEVGQPFVLSAKSGDATNTDVAATGEWVEG